MFQEIPRNFRGSKGDLKMFQEIPRNFRGSKGLLRIRGSKVFQDIPRDLNEFQSFPKGPKRFQTVLREISGCQ